MKRFSDLGIDLQDNRRVFECQQISITEVVNCEIEVTIRSERQGIETERGTMYNYNCEANEEQLRADGYLPEDEI